MSKSKSNQIKVDPKNVIPNMLKEIGLHPFSSILGQAHLPFDMM